MVVEVNLGEQEVVRGEKAKEQPVFGVPALILHSRLVI